MKVRMQEQTPTNSLPRLEQQMFTTAFAFSRRHTLSSRLAHIILKVPMIVYAYISILSAIGMFLISDDVLKQVFLAASAVATLGLTIFKFFKDVINERKQKRLAKQLQLAEFKIEEMELENARLRVQASTFDEERQNFRHEIRSQCESSRETIKVFRAELDDLKRQAELRAKRTIES